MAAPKHNLFALGNNGGRPRKFKTPEDMEVKIMEYFEWCIENKMEIAITGLALYLGFTTRQNFYEYQEREEFTDLIKRARTAVEMSYELDLRTFKFGGAVFALKNMGWTDEVTQHQKVTGKREVIVIKSDAPLAGSESDVKID